MFLRGDRDYIQGTQIVARASEVLPLGDWSLESAKFARITRNLVTFQKAADPDAVGSIHFRAPGLTETVHAIETTTAAERRDDLMPVICQYKETDAVDQTVYAFSNVATFEDLLNSFVIALKGEHERRFPGARDIWFTGLRGGDLPVSRPPAEGLIDLNLMRRLAGEPAHQTMWRCTLTNPAGHTLHRSAITFSFVPGAH